MRSWFFGLIAALVLVLILLAVVSRLTRREETLGAARQASRAGCSQVAAAFRRHDSGEWLTMSGRLRRILPDSHGASTHQRFILRCPAGQTVLIDNNVDMGSRARVHTGEFIAVHGQYIWNHLGGLIHDTHHSTDTNPSGWVLAGNNVYQ